MDTQKQYYTQENLPLVLQEAFEKKEVYTASGQRVPLGSNVTLEEAESLYSAVRQIQPAVSAEVGFAQGVSTLTILQGLSDIGQGQHHVIDPFQKEFEYVGVEMVKRSALTPY